MTQERIYRVFVRNTKTGRESSYYGLFMREIETIDGKQYTLDGNHLAEVLSMEDITREFYGAASYFEKFGTACE